MNNYYGYQQPYAYPQMGYQNYPQQMAQQNNESNIIMCDSLDYVKSQNVRLDGGTNYYGLTNGQTIYAKKLNPNTGTSIIQEYKLVVNEEEKINTNKQIESMIQDLQNSLNEIKNIVLEYATKPSMKGGEVNE